MLGAFDENLSIPFYSIARTQFNTFERSNVYLLTHNCIKNLCDTYKCVCVCVCSYIGEAPNVGLPLKKNGKFFLFQSTISYRQCEEMIGPF